jgi:hypothetical protein
MTFAETVSIGFSVHSVQSRLLELSRVAAAAAVKDMGAEKFLRLLLENLKGNYVAS